MATADAGARIASGAAGVYVHLPFCTRICPYCDFAVTVARSGEMSRLVDALRAEIESSAPDFEHPIDTVYFGGGTPSLLEPGALGELIENLRRYLRVEVSCRVFLEANPEDVSAQTVAAWRDLGVTTLSLGVQSFDAEALRFLGRGHSPAQARRAIELALGAGFETVSVDLIYARPGQSVDDWMAELDMAAGIGPDHLSCYQLTVNPSTPFGRLAERGRLGELPQELQADLLVATHERLEVLGWRAYEVSNFARSPAHRSRHNLKYWNGTPYLGLGPSAHSFAAPRRWWNVADSGAYVDRMEMGVPALEEREELTSGQLLLERLMLGLRTTDGVDLLALERRFDADLLTPNLTLIERWCESGWVRLEAGRLAPTKQGLAVADGLAGSLELCPRGHREEAMAER